MKSALQLAKLPHKAAWPHQKSLADPRGFCIVACTRRRLELAMTGEIACPTKIFVRCKEIRVW
jgi:hypothetical protein